MNTFSIKEALSWGWETFKKRPWFFVGVFLLVFVINVVLGVLTDERTLGFGIGSVAANILVVVVQWWLYIGLIGILLAAHDGKQLLVSQLFEQGGKTLWHYVLGSLLYILIVFVGTLLLIVPGVVWSIKYQYYVHLIVDKGLGPVAALKRSGVITKGYKWTLFLFLLALAGINIVGALVLLVGLLVTVPVSLLAIVYAYRWLERNAGVPAEPVQEGTPTPVEN